MQYIYNFENIVRHVFKQSIERNLQRTSGATWVLNECLFACAFVYTRMYNSRGKHSDVSLKTGESTLFHFLCFCEVRGQRVGVSGFPSIDVAAIYLYVYRTCQWTFVCFFPLKAVVCYHSQQIHSLR